MRKWNLALVIVLLIQIALVVVVYTRQQPAEAEPAGPWVTINQQALDKVTVANADGKSLTLKQVSGKWVVPAKADFPADADKLKTLLTKLNGERPDLPVAVSKDAWARFHVAPKKFERKLTFVDGKGHKTVVYLGSSAGAGRVYARLDGQTAVENIAFPLWQASTDPTDWLDKAYLNVVVHSAKKMLLPHVTLTRKQGLWNIAGLQAGRIDNHEKVATVVDGLSGLTWNKFDGKRSDVKLPTKATFTLTVTPEKGEPVTYAFYETPGKPATAAKAKAGVKNDKKAAKPSWRVTRSDGQFVLSVDDADVEPLLKATPVSLSQAKPKAPAQPASSASVAAPATAG